MLTIKCGNVAYNVTSIKGVRISALIISCFILLIATSTVFAAKSLQLSPYVSLDEISSISAAHNQKPLKKNTLTLGVTNGGFEPYEIIQGENLKGIAADYLSIIGKKLNLHIKVFSYSNRNEAIRALKNGEIDILTSALTSEQPGEGLIQSTPYTVSRPIIVGRSAEIEFSKLKREGEIGYVDTYISKEKIAEKIPSTTLTKFDSTLSALHAIEYRKTSWFIGDPATIYFYMNKGELNQLHTYLLKDWPEIGYSFLLRSEDKHLTALLNEAISSISTPRKNQILNYWFSGPDIINVFDQSFNRRRKNLVIYASGCQGRSQWRTSTL